MKMNYAHYEALAGLFDFPGPDFIAQGRELVDLLWRDHRYPDAAIEVTHFLDALPATTLAQQELHTRTFDVQALTTLDAGYVLFGDDYKRGELLSHLTREHAQVRNDCRGELADHLPNLLRLIPKLADAEVREELVTEILVPALGLMIREFDAGRIEKKNANYLRHYKTVIDPASGEFTAYQRALSALLDVLRKDFALADGLAPERAERRPQSVDFLRLIEKEMEIEVSANPVNSGCDA
jgi:nitrate reductase assembly molybdenum cofactor insertion protein NarJ